MNNFNLPNFCFANDVLEEDKIILLKYGISGYYETGKKGNAMDYNKDINVSENEMKAMVAGSMFGWDVPGANPNLYEEMKL